MIIDDDDALPQQRDPTAQFDNRFFTASQLCAICCRGHGIQQPDRKLRDAGSELAQSQLRSVRRVGERKLDNLGHVSYFVLALEL